MANVTVSINKPRQLHIILQAERKRIESDTKKLVRTYSVRIQREIVRSMIHDRKTGIKYFRPNGVHQASAAGESPAVDSGELVKSIKRTYSNAGWTGHVGTKVDYAEYLEKGTGRMRARPAFSTSLETQRTNFLRAMKLMIAGA